MRLKLMMILLLVSSAAHSQSVNMVSGGDYLPYSDKKNAEGGMATEIVKKALAESKMELKMEWQPWARAYDETKKGAFAGAFPFSKSPERESEMLFSEPIVKLEARVFMKAGAKKFSFVFPNGYTGSSFCSPIGWAIPTKLVDMVKSGQIKVQSPKDIGTCAKLVEAERADFFVTEEPNGKAVVIAAGLPADSVVLASVPALSEVGIFLIAPKSASGSKNVIAAFNKGLEALKKNGSYEKIIKAYNK